MPHIQISDLSLNGADLFDDPEDFLQDLSDRQLLAIHGGSSVISQVTLGVGLVMVEDQPTVMNVVPVSTSESNGAGFLA
jgi:hypothetical protein